MKRLPVHLLMLAVCAAPVLAGTGCADSAGLHGRMTDEEVRSVASREFERGMTLEDVHHRLDGLNVGRKYRVHYAATGSRPEVLLVRLFDGGFWVESEHDAIDWIDLSFVFGADGFDRVVFYRDRMEYFDGGPLHPPARPAAGPVRRFPAPIPPPIDPLEGAR